MGMVLFPWPCVGLDQTERMVTELGAGLSSGPHFAAGWTSSWTQQSCLEQSVLSANSCPGRKAGRYAASGVGAQEQRRKVLGPHWASDFLLGTCDPGVMALCLGAEKSWLPHAGGTELPCSLEGCRQVSLEGTETLMRVGKQIG